MVLPMRLSALAATLVTFLIAGTLAFVASAYSVSMIEDSSEIGVRDALDSRGMTWAEVEADGLQVMLTGQAQSEAVRFEALTAAGTVVDSARVIDKMDVEATADLAPPRFSVELLRNDDGLSIIGLIPTETGRDNLLERVNGISGVETVSELVETAAHPAPDGWRDAIAFGLRALETLPRSKVSVEAGYVAIRAIAESAADRERFEEDLQRATPADLSVIIDIAAPRPVITPFTLRFVKNNQNVRFDACSADTEGTGQQIVAAARTAGLAGDYRCKVGLGNPSRNWGRAVEQAIAAVDDLGGGTVTFSDADITLIALEGTDQALFDRVVGELENDLPEVFALQAKLPIAQDPSQGPPEFTATRSPEGLVQLRGRLSDENLRTLVDSYARAAFGSDSVHTAARIVPDLPRAWPLRVLTGLEALAQLDNGAVTVTPETLRIQGSTGNPEASTNIASLLADKLGGAEDFDIRVRYVEALDPVAATPTADECEIEIAGILKTSKISFEPGSATIDSSALGTMDDIAEILKQCGGIKLEIQGHTDSQGREIMNLELSQARAQSVLNELRARRVLTSTFSAKGYGETQPIADNDTEEGREANRRIEFRLIRPKPTAVDTETTLESLTQSGDTGTPNMGASANDETEGNTEVEQD